MVNEKELKVIEQISKENDLTQRELSRRTKLSLGAINIILKRLVIRGLIKTKNLTPKKVEYIITPKGVSEKASKTYDYVRKTIAMVSLVKNEIARIVLEEFNRGQKKFIILGKSNLADIIELALKGFDHKRIEHAEDIKNNEAMVLIADKKLVVNNCRNINIANRLSEIYWGVTDEEK
jgi:DNA-binding MarR family transcriptional regulator